MTTLAPAGMRQQLSVLFKLSSRSIMEDDFQNILMNGINFGRGGERKDPNEGKVKTKAKKKQYITGAHGSGSAKQKAKYREQRAKRR